eukprot:TRINITY_DN7540_c0_g1_i1.p1 TRINITY_DN7540_c0_g1~~TRINITY_DN7540_c0_g1_i1.p1  ORF type:complete len:486 (+),score=91.66 TRINITY_DN7540_c0_g1_i1:146-1603(+)
MGFLTALTRTILDMCVVTLVIVFMPGFPPYNTFTQYRLPDNPEWTGPLQANSKLNLVDRLFENQIKGPESFATYDGYIYTGLMSGLIVKIDPEDLSITPVARIGTNCEGQHEDVKCGRPLGLQFTPDGNLLVCDAVFGVHMLQFNRDDDESVVGRITSHRHQQHVSYEQLLNPDDIYDGSPNILCNSLVLGKDNRTVYISVSSTKFPLRDGMFELISDPTGRIVQLDLETRQVKVILDKLNFVNGLEIDPSGEYLIATETGRASLHKVHLTGDSDKPTHEVLSTQLPGLPDNVRVNDRGNFYVGIISPRLPNTWHILELVAPHNLIRKFVSRLIYMVLMPVKLINYVFPTTTTRKFEYWCGNLEPFAQLSNPYGLVVEVDGKTGEIISSLHSTNGAVRFISEAMVVGRWIYLGSPYTNYLARIPTRLRDFGAAADDENLLRQQHEQQNDEDEEVRDAAQENIPEEPDLSLDDLESDLDYNDRIEL